MEEFKNFYLESKFDEALEWLKNHKQEMSSEVFHYNYGTTLLKKGEFPAARYHFEIAKKMGLNNSELKANLENSKIPVKNYENSENFFEGLTFYSTEISPDVFFLASSVLFFVGVLVYKFIRSKVLAIVLAVFAFSLVSFKTFYVDKKMTGVLLKETSLREGPSEVFSSSNNLPAGVKVILEKKYQDWVFIIYPQKMTGWVNAQDVGFL